MGRGASGPGSWSWWCRGRGVDFAGWGGRLRLRRRRGGGEEAVVAVMVSLFCLYDYLYQPVVNESDFAISNLLS